MHDEAQREPLQPVVGLVACVLLHGLMKRLDLDMIVRYDGKLAQVVAIGEGRTIGLRYIGQEPCPTCGRPAGIELLEHAPLLQDRLEPVSTVVA